jgi:hypothetical protein
MVNSDIDPIIVSGLESVSFKRHNPQYPEQVRSLEGLELDLVYGPFDGKTVLSRTVTTPSCEYTEESYAGLSFERVRKWEGSADINNVDRTLIGIMEASEKLVIRASEEHKPTSYWIGFLEDQDDEYVLHGLPAGEITYNVMHAFVVAWNRLSRMEHV